MSILKFTELSKITFEFLPSASCSANEVLEKNCKILKYDVVQVRIQLSKAYSECRLRGVFKLRWQDEVSR